MHPNAKTLQDFYACFGRRDAGGMVACYDPSVAFSDPVFPDLKGAEAIAMWRMLCERAKDLRIEASAIEADDGKGRAHWDAWYLFSKTGRQVHNQVDATFEFREGKIVRHADRFDLWRWAGMALGLKGRLLGWAPFVQRAIRKEADGGLRDYIRKTAG